MKRWKNTTKGGCTILSIHGPDADGYFAGAVQTEDQRYHAFSWNEKGEAKTTDYDAADDKYNLLPAEPEIEVIKGAVVAYRDKYGIPGFIVSFTRDNNLKLGFCKETGKLLTAEVLP